MSMFYRISGMLIFAAAFANQLHAEPGASATQLAPWQAGHLDIHHIQTGRGNATFAIFPDGTTLLIDAGALADDWARDYELLRLAPAAPDNSRRPGEWIADYIAQFSPSGMTALDYAVVTHFHADHYGEVQPSSPPSRLADVAETWPVRMLIDRDYPDYSFPVRLRDAADGGLHDYLNVVTGK
jgi:glyoxylase-like metal-dependent hydrolase (beta-lactamase superfamily II)